ncbi:MAG: Hpt domain-containing protein [Anaerolineales bacterium]|jgi:HPt (histidine-containing phosphotransfer) domain-containing protein|uniref:Hpt domain-containing protein n=1 Tax=Candidatus Villigracilis vicinus TaxID=3140679 RepID=UPI003136ECAA|nr:Hpt domain-containing protein [Anaerolineales bacterium]MBK7450103.1 Hpt domain-containing protein [Anaerolineales bacterium]MBK9782123.1 Hpt domain-containing protein [Anaerolineales bacterium]
MSVLDLITFNALKESTGADFIEELIDAFLEDAVTQIAEMKSALAAQDSETFRRAAHSLKSNAATFGAGDLAVLARELEMLGRERNLETGNKIEILQEAFEQVKIQLNRLR